MPNYFEPEIECASRETLRQIQSQRLVKMVKHCYEHVPFYKKKFDEIGLRPEDIQSIDDLQKLPFTTKQDLRDTYPFGLIAVPRDDLARVHASSGTTGKQTVVAYTQNDLDIWARSAARSIVGCGGTHEDFVHVSYGYGLFTGGLGLHDGAEKLGATVIPVSSGNTNRQVQILQDYGSDILCCTPSYAMYIGETVRDKGIDPESLRVRIGIFGAEPWTEEMRREIEKALAIKAYDIYGLSKSPARAWPASAPSKRACTSRRTSSSRRLSTPPPASSCPMGRRASWCSLASAKRRCPSSATAPGTSAPSPTRSAPAAAPPFA